MSIKQFIKKFTIGILYNFTKLINPLREEEIYGEMNGMIEDGLLKETYNRKTNRWDYRLTKKGKNAGEILFGKDKHFK